jgi:hypothetical protein
MWVAIGFAALLVAALAVAVAISLMSQPRPVANGGAAREATASEPQARRAQPVLRPAPVRRPPPIAPSRAADARMVVLQFYQALGEGDGATAAGFVVPEERRSGPLSANALTRTYTSLESPLKLST